MTSVCHNDEGLWAPQTLSTIPPGFEVGRGDRVPVCDCAGLVDGGRHKLAARKN